MIKYIKAFNKVLKQESDHGELLWIVNGVIIFFGFSILACILENINKTLSYIFATIGILGAIILGIGEYKCIKDDIKKIIKRVKSEVKKECK